MHKNNTLSPDTALFQQAFQLHQQGQLQQAEVLYEEILKIQPQHVDALHFLGVLANQQGQTQRAVDLISQSLAIDPNNGAAHSNLSFALQTLERFDEAIASCDHALALNPNHAEAHYNRGDILIELKRYEEALVSYDRGLSINPDLDYKLGDWLYTKMKMCNWRELNNSLKRLTKKITLGEKVSAPFIVLALSSSAALQKQIAQLYTQAKYPSHFLSPPLAKHSHSKIKIGYFSSDFRQHPVSYLTAELFERHDRTRFEIIAFSFIPASDKDEMRLRLETAFDKFIDVSQQTDEQVVRLARELELDIAVNLNGHTGGGRTNIFAMRAAPIQVSYIGYLGTMGADYMDYLLADTTLIPAEHQAYYTEKVAYLPNSFQVNDSTLVISDKKFTRAELDLPEQGFVFCCFNSNYKITPTVFASWMRLLSQVQGSVLWLLADNTSVETNLRHEAAAHGIDANRLVFAKRLPMPEYLARHRLADLFLDTSPYNAGATASAALWAGLPVLSYLGETFAGRMGASLLHAIGLPELITNTLAEYEALAIQLATHPKQLALIKQKLADNRLSYPLFNTALFTQHIESAFQTMFDRYQADLAPEHIYVSKKDHEQYVDSIKATESNTDAVEKLINEGNELEDLNRLEEALATYDRALSINPNYARTHSNRGNVLQSLKRFDDALASYNQALAIQPDYFAAFYNRGNTLLACNRLQEAIISYERALAIKPDFVQALMSLGNALYEDNRTNDAIHSYEQALTIQPDCAEALDNLNNILHNLEHTDYVQSLCNQGNTLQDFNYNEQALAIYDRALAIQPNCVEALSNRGRVLTNLKRYDEALANYDDALKIKPDYAEVFYDRAVVFIELTRYNEALLDYERALTINPEYAEALCSCAIILQELERYDEAMTRYQQALAIKPDLEFIYGSMLFFKMRLCNWSDFDASLKRIAHGVAQGKKICEPFSVQAISSSLSVQKKAAEIFIATKYPSAFLLPVIVKKTHQKIKVGYFSSDFCHHPVAYLMAELFERHDRSRFEVIAFSFNSISQKDEMRLRLETVFDQFIDVNQQTDEQVVRLARELELDIAVDLNGHTRGGRTNIFAMRAAPIQVSYIGYLGTIGADYMDYLLADRTLIPKEHQAYYSEKIAYLPDSFQVNDSTLSIPNKVFTRAELDLPEQGFVFCCFNNHYKITPTVFDSWMRILSQVKDSVLWLLGDNTHAETNLRLEATARGIDVNRLVFAKRLPMPEYLACHRLADLFLDTAPYNAGATASAALWAGLPVLTCLGDTFSSRMGASLLHAIGLPELITKNAEDYEALAIQLATHPKQLALIKQKLADNRLTQPLFNTPLFTQHIESAFQTMYERYQADLAPEHIYVPRSTTLTENQTKQPKPLSLFAKIIRTPAKLFAGITTFGKNKKTPAIQKTKRPARGTSTQKTIIKLAQAQQLHQQGQIRAAEKLYEEILIIQPHHTEALRCVEEIKKQRGLVNENALIAVSSPKNPSANVTDTVEELINQGNELEDLNHLEEALATYDRALSINPNYARTHSNRGNVLQSLKRFDDALASYNQALAIQPDYFAAFYNRGNTLLACNRLQEAIISYERALAIKPDFIQALISLGNALHNDNRAEDALLSYERALATQPNCAEAFYNRANVLQDLNRYEQALASYDDALSIQPNYVEALYHQGNILQYLKRNEQALASYERILTIQPEYTEALYNCGNVLNTLGQTEQALASYERALAIQPDYAQALVSYGDELQTLRRFNEAYASYGRALAVNPELEFLFSAWLYLKMSLCDWDALDDSLNQLATGIERGEKIAMPFHALAFSRSAALQKKAAQLYVQAIHSNALSLPAIKKHRHTKIKLGYFSSDFREHPVTHLTAGLFECHDKSRFEIIAFSFSPTDIKDDTRLRLEAAFDQFIDVSKQSNEEVVQLARQLEIDIAVDLNGFTTHARPELFAFRVAPIQISYIGYLGTLGADYMDYLFADPVIIPPEQQIHYSEKIAYLPSYQVNDNTVTIANKQFTRSELGLPEQGIVFCCFNHIYKINPEVFNCWMRILQGVENSVLWLRSDNETAENNLRQQAMALGISAERILFAKQRPLPEYLAYQRVADLFLDTSPYNAGATASAALWAGLPIVTRLGETFAGRMGASLLHAIGLPELIANTVEDYEALAIQLATHPKQLAIIKQKLADNRLTQPLFNTALFTLHIESAYQMMFDRYQADLAPEHIYVSEKDYEPCFDSVSDTDAIETLINEGNELEDLNRLEEALATYDRALSINPNYARTHSNRGNVLQSLKRFDDALASYDQALAIQPDYFAAFYNRGNTLLACNRLQEAIISYERALAIKPDFIQALISLGNALHNDNRAEDALLSYERALATQPNCAEAFYNRANVLQDLNRYEQALASYDDALSIQPNYVEAHSNRGDLLLALNRFDDAILSYERALAIKPDFVQALINLGSVLHYTHRAEDAILNYERALAVQPNCVEAISKRGYVLHSLNRFDEAFISYNRALEIAPNYVDAMLYRGVSLQVNNRLQEALLSFDNALSINPQHSATHWNKSLCLLLMGDYISGFQEYEWRWQYEPEPNVWYFSVPPWLGKESLQDKTILVYAEQGHGDTIQFFRYVEKLIALGASVILVVQHGLKPLFERVKCINAVYVIGQPLPIFDCVCPFSSLPLAFQTSISSIPASPQYLTADPERVAKWRDKLGEKVLPRVGLVWSGNPAHKNDHNRSIPLTDFMKLVSHQAEFYSLQKDLTDADRLILNDSHQIRNIGEQINDFADTAALIELMDLVITVDTSAAHLAGAIGKPVWILLPFHPDWRWLLDREDSPWYPSARLFRQPAIGDWNSVIDMVKRTLNTSLLQAIKVKPQD